MSTKIGDFELFYYEENYGKEISLLDITNDEMIVMSIDEFIKRLTKGRCVRWIKSIVQK